MISNGSQVASNASVFTEDVVRKHGLVLRQPRDGYRFSLDPLILCDFCRVRDGEHFFDLGTGSGVIPLVLARQAAVSGVGIDHQEQMARLAADNVAANGLMERVSVLHLDVLDVRRKFSVSSCDLVTANPPYRVPGEGKTSPKAGRDLARHESTAGLAGFLAAAKYLVKPSGRMCFIYLAARVPEFFAVAAQLKLAPLRMRMVHGSPEAPAKMALIELAKGRKKEFVVEPPLFVRNQSGGYTPEAASILGE